MVHMHILSLLALCNQGASLPSQGCIGAGLLDFEYRSVFDSCGSSNTPPGASTGLLSSFGRISYAYTECGCEYVPEGDDHG